MKTTLIENMLTGFTSEQAARDAATALSKSDGVWAAEYHDADNEEDGDLTMYNGFGHCVRLVIEQRDNSELIAYHDAQVAQLSIAYQRSLDECGTAHEAGSRTASDLWSEISTGLDKAIHFHGRLLAQLRTVE